MDTLHVTEAVASIFDYIARANKYVEESKPWALAKDESKKDELASVMNHLANALRQCAIMLKIVLLDSTEKLFNQLGIEKEYQGYDSLEKFDVLGGEHLVKGDPLFPRLKADEEIEFIKSLMAKH